MTLEALNYYNADHIGDKEQLALLKIVANHTNVEIFTTMYINGIKWAFMLEDNEENTSYLAEETDFVQALKLTLNFLWQYFSDKEKEAVKRILQGGK